MINGYMLLIATRLLRSFLPAAVFVCVMVGAAFGASNISGTARFAWSENTGWMNFLSANGGVTVYSDHLAGYAWHENIGWIMLGAAGSGPYQNSSVNNWGVNLDATGNLSGFAWSEGWGWINFHPMNGGVTFNSANGIFDGHAWGENIGWIHFKSPTALYNVATVPYTLHIAFNPAETGSGTVSSNSPAINCNTDYFRPFFFVLPLTLDTSPGTYSLFNAWSGCDTTPGTSCQLTLSQDRTATVNFDLDMVHAARINTTYYSSLAGAYVNANMTNGTFIRAWGIIFPENGLTCGGSTSVTLTGGYDEHYNEPPSGMTTIRGYLSISGTGGVTAANIVVK
jgi:hypothetical protein